MNLKTAIDEATDPAAFAVEMITHDAPDAIGELTERERTLMELAWIHGKRYGIEWAQDEAIRLMNTFGTFSVKA